MPRSCSPSTSEANEALLDIPTCPNGLFNFSPLCTRVIDADEEILELYMNLASTNNGNENEDSSRDSGGLGFLDTTQSILELSIDLRPGTNTGTITSTDVGRSTMSSSSGRKGRAAKIKKNTSNISGRGVDVIDVKVQQDLGALRGRKGDTGSVLWRSSLHLGQLLLSQHHHHPLAPLLNPSKLANTKILELGAGTGLLAALLSPLCAEYTASDLMENLKLVKRNLELNGVEIYDSGLENHKPLTGGGNHQRGSKGQEHGKEVKVRLEEIDWVALSTRRQRQRQVSSPRSSLSYGDNGRQLVRVGGDQYDLILAVDCIYNEHLAQPLVDTLNHHCQPGGKTIVWIVVELRSADVLTTFLEKWLADDSKWCIVRLDEECMGKWKGEKARWVGWVGWRESAS